MMTTPVLITGCNGFVGKVLLQTLIDSGAGPLYGTDKQDSSSSDSPIPYYPADFTCADAVRELIHDIQPASIFHLAGVVQAPEPQTFYRIHVDGTLALLDSLSAMAQEGQAVRCVVMGSAAEYGLHSKEGNVETDPAQPVTHYGISKLALTHLAKMYTHMHALDVVIVRPTNIIGPGQTGPLVVPEIIRQIGEQNTQEEISLLLGNTSTRRDFIDVRDTASGVLAAMESGIAGTIYNIGTNKATSVNEIIALCRHIVGKPLTVHFDEQRMRPSDIPAQSSNSRALHTVSGWRPSILLEQTLSDMLRPFLT